MSEEHPQVQRREKPLTTLEEACAKFLNSTDRAGVGLMFHCPIHLDCWIVVPFANPVDGGEPPYPGQGWRRQGDSLSDLSLEPSIRIIDSGDGCAWHGFIRNGQIETCGDSR